MITSDDDIRCASAAALAFFLRGVRTNNQAAIPCID